MLRDGQRARFALSVATSQLAMRHNAREQASAEAGDLP